MLLLAGPLRKRTALRIRRQSATDQVLQHRRVGKSVTDSSAHFDLLGRDPIGPGSTESGCSPFFGTPDLDRRPRRLRAGYCA